MGKPIYKDEMYKLEAWGNKSPPVIQLVNEEQAFKAWDVFQFTTSYFFLNISEHPGFFLKDI